MEGATLSIVPTLPDQQTSATPSKARHVRKRVKDLQSHLTYALVKAGLEARQPTLHTVEGWRAGKLAAKVTFKFEEEQTEFFAVVAAFDDRIRAICKEILDPHHTFSGFDLEDLKHVEGGVSWEQVPYEIRSHHMDGDLGGVKARLDPKDIIDKRILATISAMKL